jgi:hypothetical protein
MSIPFTNEIEFGPVILTYTFEPGRTLPDVGDVIEDDKCTLVVTDVDAENNSVTVMLTTVETVSSRLKRYSEELEKSMFDIAKLIYTKTAGGMTALIGWENLPEKEKNQYIKLTRSIIGHLNENKLLILQYEPEE